jgi:hypothetical protein
MLRAPESLPIFNKMVNSFKFVNASGSTNTTKSTLNNQTQTPSLNDPNQRSIFNTQTDNTASDSGVNTLQPVSPIQQFNQDTGSGPLCCNVGGASTTTPVGGSESTTELGNDDTTTSSTNDDDVEDDNDDEDSKNDDNDDSEDEDRDREDN